MVYHLLGTYGQSAMYLGQLPLVLASHGWPNFGLELAKFIFTLPISLDFVPLLFLSFPVLPWSFLDVFLLGRLPLTEGHYNACFISPQAFTWKTTRLLQVHSIAELYF